MRIIATLFATLLTVGSMAQVNKRSDTFIQQDVGLDVTTLMAVPKTDNISGLSGYSGAPIYFNPTNKRLHAHDGTSWIPFAQYNEVVRTDGAQTINGIKNFTSPVYGPQAVADGQYVTREQVLPLAMTGTGIVRLLDAPKTYLDFPTTATGLFRLGPGGPNYSLPVPAGTFSNVTKWMLRLKFQMYIDHQSTISNRRLAVAVEFVQGGVTRDVMLFDHANYTFSTDREDVLNTELRIQGVGNLGEAFAAVESSVNRHGLSTSVNNYSGGVAITGINFSQAFSIQIRLYRTSALDYYATINPLTIEAANLDNPLPEPI